VRFPIPFSFALLCVTCASLLLPSQGRGGEPATSKIGAAAAAQTAQTGWTSLFDGKTLSGWKHTPFGGGTEAEVENGLLQVEAGEELSGVQYTKPVPRMGYEVSLEAMRRTGLDFFCALTFPVAEKHLTFVVGGWGGSTVGLSSIDKQDASQNETHKIRFFKDNQWYKIRLRVEPERIQAWIDQEQVVDVNTKGKSLDLRPGEIEISVPFALATFRTSASFRAMQLRTLPSGDGK
jgi:hypothetical protein